MKVFATVVLFYILFYASFGMNESDGGFMDGYAWQLLCGKKLYSEVFYVRSPLPVWLRMWEIRLLPDHFQILGERIIWFLKIAAYSWLAADFFSFNSKQTQNSKLLWLTATFAFIVSVHCYPPASLHTFDGIFFSVLGLWLFSKNCFWAAGVAVFAAAICKQSFYPIPLVLLGLAIFEKRWEAVLKISVAFACSLAAFVCYMKSEGILDDFLRRTAAASDSGMLLQQGIFNLFRINPFVAAGAAVFIFLFLENEFRGERRQGFEFRRHWAVGGLIFWLSISYAVQVWLWQGFVVPVAQSRILFWLALGWAAWQFFFQKNRVESLRFLAMLAITWCCTVSWGYSYPIQFAAPGVFVLVKILGENPAGCWRRHQQRQTPNVVASHSKSSFQNWGSIAALILLLSTFRVGYEFCYRDGRRSEMTFPVGDIFPKATGIFTDRKTFEKYAELKILWERYPAEKAVLPWFCQAHFLLNTRPVLPLDWVCNREMNSDTALIFRILDEKRPTVFLEKSLLPLVLSDPEHTVSQHVFRRWRRVAEGEFYLVFQP